MVVRRKIIYALMFFISIFLYAETEKKLLVDEAGVLQPGAFTKIEKYLETISQKSESDAVVVIVSDSGEKSPQDYADDYFDYNGYGQGDQKEGSLLLILTGDGTPGSRYAHISTHGEKTIETLNDDVIEDLLDSLIDGGLKDNDYLDGIKSYLNTLSRRFYNSLSLLEVAISLAIAILFFLLIYVFYDIIKEFRMESLEEENKRLNRNIISGLSYFVLSFFGVFMIAASRIYYHYLFIILPLATLLIYFVIGIFISEKR